MTAERAADGGTAVERSGIQSVPVFGIGAIASAKAGSDQRSRQQKRQFGIIGRLPGDCVEGAAIGHFAHTARIEIPELICAAQPDQPSEGIAADLDEHTDADDHNVGCGTMLLVIAGMPRLNA